MSDRITRLEWLDRRFLPRLLALMAQLAAAGIPLSVFETARSPMRQSILYERGRDPLGLDYGRTVTRARAYESAHQYGLAVDLVFRVGNAWTWDEPEHGMWARMSAMANAEGLQTLSFERPHVQLPPFSPAHLEHGPMATADWLTWLGARNAPPVA